MIELAEPRESKSTYRPERAHEKPTPKNKKPRHAKRANPLDFAGNASATLASDKLPVRLHPERVWNAPERQTSALHAKAASKSQ